MRETQVRPFQMTIRLEQDMRVRLDRRVEELRRTGAPVERASLAAAILRRGLAVEGADSDVVSDVVAKLVACARNLRARGAIPADQVEGLAAALDELAARLGGAGGGEDEQREAALSPTSRAALRAGPESGREASPVYLGSFAAPGIPRAAPAPYQVHTPAPAHDPFAPPSPRSVTGNDGGVR